MSDPQWPDLSSPYPDDRQRPSQRPQRPTAPRGSHQGAPSPYGPPASGPFAPYGSPDDAGQFGQQDQNGQYGQYGQYGQPGPTSRSREPRQSGQYGQYGQYGTRPPEQAPNPFEQSGYEQSGYPAYPGNPYQQGGQAAYPTNPSPYGRPSASSRPMYPYPQDGPTLESTPFSRPGAASSRPLSPYDQAESPSRTLAPYGQFGPSSRDLLPSDNPPPKQRKRSLTWLWITLGVVVLLIAAGGGGALYVVGQLAAPAAAATQFCTDLKTQSYDAAYSLLSSSLRTQYPRDQFVQGSQALDQLEGQVTACQPSTSGGDYHYNFGANSATVAASLSRQKQPNALSGSLHLVSEGGSWKISGIGTSLLGVNLGALQTATGFCAAAQRKDYATATGLIASSLKVTQSDWATWDQIGGPIKSCALQGLGSGNTDSAANFEIAISRAHTGDQTGALALALQGGTWKVSRVDADLLGPDIGPLKVGGQFCQDILKNSFGDAYGLLSSSLKQAVGSQDNFAADFALPSGVYYADCKPNLSTYKVNGTTGAYAATLSVSNGSQSQNVAMSLSFVQENDGWKVDDWTFSVG